MRLKSSFNNKTIFGAIVSVIFLIILIVCLILIVTPKFFQKPTSSSPSSPPQSVEKFESVVSQLSTPKEVVDFLNTSFVLTPKEESEEITLLTPEEIFYKQKGTPFDLAIFSIYVLSRHNYEAFFVRYKFDGKIGTIALIEQEGPFQVIIFTDKGAKIMEAFSIKDALQKEAQRLQANIFEYQVGHLDVEANTCSFSDWQKF